MRSCKSGVNMVYRLLAVLFLITASIITRAQDLPCDGTDPYTTCPLDTWIVVLVVIAGLFTAVHLHRKQKAL